MSDRIGVGFIGCGGMAKGHLRILKTFRDVEFKGFADVRLEAAQGFQGEAGEGYATDEPERILGDRNIGAVLICTHHDSHGPLAVRAIGAGKAVFVEKPLTLTREGCREVVEAAEAAGARLMVGFQARFSPFVRKLKRAVPRPLVTVGQLVDPHWGEGSWANDPIKGGGNVLSQGCHLFDMIYWLNESEPTAVHAEGGNFTHPTLPITDSVVATIRFANGSVGSAVVGDFGAPGLVGKAFYEVFDGTRTATLYRYYSEPAIRFWGMEPTEFTLHDLPEAERDSAAAHGYVAQIRAFIHWAKGGAEPVEAAKARDGLRATAMGLRAIESIRTGRTLPVW